MAAYMTPETEPEPTLRERARALRANPHTWEILCSMLERTLASTDVAFIRACSPEVVLKLLDRLDELEAELATKAKTHTRFSAEDVLQRLEDLEQKVQTVAYVGRVDSLENRTSRLEGRVDNVLPARMDSFERRLRELEKQRTLSEPEPTFAQPGGGNYYVQRQKRVDDMMAASGQTEPREVPADFNAPTDVALLPDYWDARRLRQGKPDKSRCAQDLRLALHHRQPRFGRRPWKGDRVNWHIFNSGRQLEHSTGFGTVKELPTGPESPYLVACDDGETREFDVSCLMVVP